jgi:hypothetical protein
MEIYYPVVENPDMCASQLADIKKAGSASLRATEARVRE